MIAGTVNDQLQAIIPLQLRDSAGNLHFVDAVVDSGFNGFLTLPSIFIARLGLPWIARQQGLTADGGVHTFEVYATTLNWEGVERQVETEIVESDPLVGMALLGGHDLQIRVEVGGPVEVRSIS